MFFFLPSFVSAIWAQVCSRLSYSTFVRSTNVPMLDIYLGGILIIIIFILCLLILFFFFVFDFFVSFIRWPICLMMMNLKPPSPSNCGQWPVAGGRVEIDVYCSDAQIPSAIG